MFVFPMAGMSRRFREAGYDRPKYMLDAHGAPLFDHAVAGFGRYFSESDFLFICREEAGTPAFVHERCEALGISRARRRVVVLEQPTAGQAETVAIGVRQSEAAGSTPLTIFNIDTMRRDFEHPSPKQLEASAGYLEVFRGEGEHWSFVEPVADQGSFGVAKRVTEKERISELCSNGLYHFARADSFLDLFAEIADTPPEQLQGGERYIAPLYNRLIQRGEKVTYQVVPPGKLAFFGTPAEYDAFLGSEAEAPAAQERNGR